MKKERSIKDIVNNRNTPSSLPDTIINIIKNNCFLEFNLVKSNLKHLLENWNSLKVIWQT